MTVTTQVFFPLLLGGWSQGSQHLGRQRRLREGRVRGKFFHQTITPFPHPPLRGSRVPGAHGCDGPSRPWARRAFSQAEKENLPLSLETTEDLSRYP